MLMCGLGLKSGYLVGCAHHFIHVWQAGKSVYDSDPNAVRVPPNWLVAQDGKLISKELPTEERTTELLRDMNKPLWHLKRGLAHAVNHAPHCKKSAECQAERARVGWRKMLIWSISFLRAIEPVLKLPFMLRRAT